MTGQHPPVSDWETDFDHTDPTWAADPFPIWDELRKECPIAHSDRYGGVWLPTRHEDVAAVAYDTEHFSSRSVIVSKGRPIAPAPIGVAPPISSDPPFHSEARRILLPAFAPQAIARLEESTRALCHALADEIEATGPRDADGLLADAATQYAQHIPVAVIARMLGFPNEDADQFRTFVHNTLEGVDLPQEERIANFGRLMGYLGEQIADHIERPRDDLTNFLLRAELQGEPLQATHVMGTIGLLLIAGIDTTWSAIGASIWHLAGHPADQARLVADPTLIPVAVEEFLRAYTPVTMARLVKEDFEYDGCPMHADEWVLLPFPAANRDPEVFEHADEVIIDRQINRHAAFGLGIHRCLGSNLARMELRVALEVWLERFPVVELSAPDEVTWSGGQVRGPRELPVRITT